MNHHQITHSVNNPVVIMDLDAGHFIDCNDLALDLFKMSKDELLQTSPSKLSPANVYGHEAEIYSRQLMQEAMAGANPAFDWIHIDKDGKEIPCEVRLIRFPPYERNLVRGTIIHKDDNNRIVRRASESRLILTLESAMIGTFDWFPQVDQLTWDNRLYEIFELNPDSRIDLNAHFFSLIHPDDKDRVSKNFDKTFEPEGPSHNRIEYRIVINEKTKYLLAHSRMIRDDKGGVIRMLGTTQDITEVRESEQKLREHEELLDSIIQDQREMIIRWLPDGVPTFVNKAYCESFGLTIEQAMGESFFSRLEESFKEKFLEEVRKLTPKNPVRNYTLERTMPNGDTVWQEWSDRAYFNDKGNATEFQSVGRDITALKASEEKQRLYADRLIAISKNLPGVVLRYKLNPDFTDSVEFVSDGMMNILGVSLEDAHNNIHKIWSIFYPDDIAHVKQSIQESYLNLTRWYAEWRMYLPNGKLVWVQGIGQPTKQEDGSVVWDSVILDITPKIETKKRLEESEKRFRNVFNQQFQFTALLDLEGKVEHINDRVLKILGLTKEDYLGQYFWETPGWKGNNEWQQKIKSQVLFAQKTGETITVEDPYYGPDQTTQTAIASYSVIKSADGKMENILVQATDITIEKNAKKLIEDRENQLSLIYNNATDFMVLLKVDKDQFFIESANRKTIEGFKQSGVEVTEEDLIGLEIREYFKKYVRYDQETMDYHLSKYRAAVKSKQTITYVSDSTVNEFFYALETKVTPVEESGEVSYLLTTSNDITALVKSQKDLERALEEVKELKDKLQLENIYLKEEIKQANDFESMVFKSTKFREVLTKVEQVAQTDATVLITGETGTGKELIARAIHNVSKRSEKPMIKVNTAAIPKDLIESELFGHEKGAFSGAVGEKPGKFELADGGTIFLDEIGDMPHDLQVKILRVLQEGEVERLGSTKTKKIDLRVISATNKNLEAAVKDGTFREDLYFRLRVFPIEIPPLRSRPEDVPFLVEHFISKYAGKYNNPINMIPKALMDYLRNYSWPGNVRELENTIERAVILSTHETLQLPDVTHDNTDEKWAHDDSLDVVTENHIRGVLKKCDWKVEGADGAAAQLKIKPSTLRDRMRKFKIKRPK